MTAVEAILEANSAENLMLKCHKVLNLAHKAGSLKDHLTICFFQISPKVELQHLQRF